MILSLCHITIKELVLEFSFSYTPNNCRRKGYNKYLRKVPQWDIIKPKLIMIMILFGKQLLPNS